MTPTAPQATDPQAVTAPLERLVREHALVVGRVCMALLGTQREAEEALQETLLASLKEGDPVESALLERARLLAIARRGCARRLEARERQAAVRERSEGNDEPQGIEARARRLLAAVRPSEREALVLRFTAELGFSEVGLACGVAANTAQNRISGGLARLRALASEEDP